MPIVNLTQLRKDHDKSSKGDMKDEQSYHSTTGVVIDCSNIYRYEASKDYSQKIKIIDHTTTEPIQVMLWARDKDEFTNNIKVGDILFINKFKVDIYNGKYQAKKPYKKDDSEFRIFNGDPEINGYAPVDRKVGLTDSDGKLLSSINELRKFSKTFFKANKVPVVFKDDKKLSSSDFDMILKVNSCQEAINSYRIHMTNGKEEFQMNYHRNIHAGVYKIRSVAGYHWSQKYCNLTGNDYTYFLEISNWMKSFDNKEWEKLHSQKEKSKKKASKEKMETKVSSKKKKVSLKELFSRDNHNEDVRVTCQVMNIVTPFQQALRKYDNENNIQRTYQSREGKYIYAIHLLLSDESLDGEIVNAYIYSYDGKGLEFMPDCDPENIYGRNVLDMKENYERWVNRLLQESSVESCPLEVVLSPMYNGRETVYRIVDTQLLF